MLLKKESSLFWVTIVSSSVCGQNLNARFKSGQSASKIKLYVAVKMNIYHLSCSVTVPIIILNKMYQD